MRPPTPAERPPGLATPTLRQGTRRRVFSHILLVPTTRPGIPMGRGQTNGTEGGSLAGGPEAGQGAGPGTWARLPWREVPAAEATPAALALRQRPGCDASLAAWQATGRGEGQTDFSAVSLPLPCRSDIVQAERLVNELSRLSARLSTTVPGRLRAGFPKGRSSPRPWNLRPSPRLEGACLRG